MVAAPGVDEDEVVGRGGRGGGDRLEVDGRLGRGVGQAEFIKETELLAEVEISVVGVALREVQRGRAKFGVEEPGREHRIRVALREDSAGADEILELGMQADEFVAEPLELDRGDLLEVVAGQKTQVGAAKFDGGEFGGDQVADVAQQPRLGREGGCRRAENGGEFGFG